MKSTSVIMKPIMKPIMKNFTLSIPTINGNNKPWLKHLTSGLMLIFMAAALTACGGSGGSTPPPGPKAPAPAVPTISSVGDATPASLTVSWTSIINATHYQVYRDDSRIASRVTGTSYIDVGLSPATSYSYSLAACNIDNVCSTQSALVSGRTIAFALNNVFDVGAADGENYKLDGAFGVTTTIVGSNTYVLVASEYDDSLSVFLAHADGSLTLTDTVLDSDDASYLLNRAEEVEALTLGDDTYLYVTGYDDDGITGFKLENDGTLSGGFGYPDDASVNLDGAFGITSAMVGSNPYIFVAGEIDDGVSVFSVTTVGSNKGRLTHVFSVSDREASEYELDGAVAVETAVIDGKTYLFVAGFIDDGVSVFEVKDNGNLVHETSVTDDANTFLDRARSVTTTRIGPSTYLFVTSQNDNAVNIFRVDITSSGLSLIHVDSVQDDDDLELDTARYMQIRMIGDITYLFVSAVGDDGVSVFLVNNDGSLSHVTRVRDDFENNLDAPNGIAIAEVGGSLYLFVTAFTDDSISVFDISTPLPIPAVPNISVASATATSLTVSWDSVAYAKHYRVYRNNIMIESSAADTNYIDTGLSINNSYSYRLEACNDTGCSVKSETVSESTLTSGAPPPAVPTISSVVSPTPISLSVSWGSVSSATHYQIYRDNSRIESNVSGTSYTDTNLAPGTEYSYQVAACNLNSCSARSDTVSGMALIFSLDNVFNVGAVTGDNYKLDGAFGITTTIVGSSTYLLVASLNDASLSVFLAHADGSLTITDTVVDTDDSSYLLDRAAEVEVLTIGDDTYVYVTGVDEDNGITGFKLAADGTLSGGFGYPDDLSVNLGGSLGITSAMVDSNPYIFVAGFDDDGISVFSVTTDGANKGRLTHVFSVSDSEDILYELDDAVGIETAVIDGKTYLFVAGAHDDGVSVFQVKNNGNLVYETSVTDDYNTLLDGARNLAIQRIGESTYLFVNAFDDDAVNVFRVDTTTSGLSLNHVDSLEDNNDIALIGTRYMQARVIGDITYLFVSSSFDDGVSVFLVNDDGSLSHVTSLQDTPEVNLDAPNGIALAEISGSLYLFVAAFIDDAISVFAIGDLGSGTVSPTRPPPAPTVPTISSVESTTPVSLTVSWDSVVNATYYQVYQDNSNTPLSGNIAVTSYTDTDLTPNNEYSYTVAACNTADCSSQSASVPGTTLAFTLNNVFDVYPAASDDYKLVGAHGITTTIVGSNTYVLVASLDDNSLSVFLAHADGSLTLTDTVLDSDDASYLLNRAVEVEVLTIGDDTYVYVTGADEDNGITGFKLENDGTLSGGFGYPDDASVNLDGAFGITSAMVGSNPYIFVTGEIDDGVSVFSVTTDGANKGRLTHVFSVSDSEDILYELDAAVAVETAVIDGKTYLFVAGAHDDGVSVFQVKNNGNLVYETSVTDDYNTLLVGARNLAITRIGDSTYLFVTGQNDDALNVFRVDVDTSGLRLNHVDSVQDDNTLELDTARYVQARMIGGLTYLFVAGSMDDGVSVFLVNDDGSLSHVTRVQDTLDGRLNDPNGIAIAEIGGALYLFVAAFTDNAVSVFAISGAVSGGTLPPILSVPEISSVGAATTTSLRIAWGQVADATHYRVYQNNIRFADNVTDTSYTDMGLNPDTNYIYRIAACNANVCSAQSRTFRGRTLLPAPAMPNISSVENATSTSLIVSWGSVAYATHYRVYRNNSIIESSSDATNYIDTGLIINTSYSYRVDACNNIGCSAQSDAVSGRTLMSGTPGTPITLEIPTISSVVSPTPISLNVSWGSVADATHYQVYRNNSRIESRVAAAIYTDRDLIPNTNYSYAVAACNLNSCSARSEEVSGRTLAFALNNVFNVNQTSGGADYKLDGAFGVTTTVVANNTYLLVASFNDASLSVFLANANGSLTLTDTVVDTDDPSYILNSALDVEVLTLGDDTYVYVAANSIRNGGVTGFKLVANGTLSEGFGYPDDASVNLARALSITNAVVDSTPYIFVTGFNDDGISVFRVTTDGTNKGRLNHVFSVSDIDSSEYSLDGVGRIETAVIAGKTYLFVSVIVDNSISVFEVMPNGELVHETSFIDDDNTLLDGVQNVATTRIGPSTYLFSNAFADGAVNVFRVDNTTSGLRLNHVDSVQDDDDLELMGTRYMQPRVIGDLTYLFVSGEDDNGVSVFLVNDDGSLSHVTSLQDTPEVNLDAPNGIALAEISGSLYLFVAASIDDGISVFEINNP